MTDALERAARALLSEKTCWSWDDLSADERVDMRRGASDIILAFLDGQEDDVAEAIQDAADIDANSMTYARSVLRALRAAAGGEG